MASYKERVAKGAALLDEKVPGWVRKINVFDLDLGDGCCCILGQVYGGFTTGFQILCQVGGFNEGGTEEYGFYAQTLEGYDGLQEAWLKEIARRRGASNV